MSPTVRLGILSISLLALTACRAIIGAEESTLVADGGAGTSAGGKSGSAGTGGKAGDAGTAGVGGSGECPASEVLCGDGCADLLKSDGNCGWCGHGCAGQQCKDGFCDPELVTTTQNEQNILDLVYLPPVGVFFAQLKGSFERVDKEKGTITQGLVSYDSSLVAASSMTANADRLFWLQIDSGTASFAIWSYVFATQQQPPVLDPIAKSYSLTAGVGPQCSPYLFWGRTDGVLTRRAWDATGQDAPIPTLNGQGISSVVAGGDRAIFTQGGAVGANSCSTPTDPPLVISDKQNMPQKVVWVSGAPDSVFWIDVGDGSIRRSDVGGGGVGDVDPDVGSAMLLQADGSGAYYYSANVGLAGKVDETDLRRVYYPQSATPPSALALDSEYIYFAVNQRLFKTPK